jgi:hypothetical protein
MKNILNKNTFKLLTNTIGEKNIKYLEKSKLIFSSLIHSSEDYINSNKSNIIMKNVECPLFLEDWINYLIIRSYSRTWMVTRKIVKEETDIETFHTLNFHGYDDLEKYFYLGQDVLLEKFNSIPKINQELIDEYTHKRNLLFLSKTISNEDITTLKCFRENYAKKYVVKNTNIVENDLDKTFLEKNKISIINENLDTVQDYVNYAKNNLKDVFPILIEAGPITFNNILDKEQFKFDFMIVSAYTGELHAKSIGLDFPTFGKLQNSGYELVNVSEKIKCEKGYIKLHTLVNRELL